MHHRKNNNNFIKAYKAHGGSMWPFFHTDTVVFINSSSSLKLEKGNIVLFSYRGKPTLHRIIKTHNGRFLLKGDAEKSPDGWFTKSSLKGVVVGFINQGQYVSLNTKPMQILSQLTALFSLLTSNRETPMLRTLLSHSWIRSLFRWILLPRSV